MSVNEPELVTVEEFHVLGIQTRTQNRDEMSPQTAKLPRFWEQFFNLTIPFRQPQSAVYGVYADYESDHTGMYTVTAGVEASAYDTGGELSMQTIKNGNYLVFKNAGPMPQVIYETWIIIWRYFATHPELVRAYETDFERCSSSNECAIYIGIKK